MKSCAPYRRLADQRSGRPYSCNVEDATPVSMQETVVPQREPPSDLAIEPFSLPALHRDVP